MAYAQPESNHSPVPFFSDIDSLTKMHNSLPAEYGITAQNLDASQPYGNPYHPRGTDLVSDDQLSSFFDFEPPQSPSSFEGPLTTSDHSDLYSWGNHPISPPSSAVFSSPKGRPFFEHHKAPPNILTNINPAGARAQYGQVTPPDDEPPGHFGHPLDQMPAEGPLSGSVKKRKRQTAGKKESGTGTSSKRIRKNAAPLDSPDGQLADPNSPEQQRRSKFLERNRVAASKCRQKKKQWIDKTEAQARELQSQNNSLLMLVDSLKNEVLFLRGEMVRHMGCKGTNIKTFIEDEAESFGDALYADQQYQKDLGLTDTDAAPELEKNGKEPNISEVVTIETLPPSPASHNEDTKPLDELPATKVE